MVINGLVVQYAKTGKEGAPILVFLHGWGQTGATFDALAQAFVNDYCTIAPDFPGFGRSEAPKSGWSVGDYAAFLHAFFDKLGVEPFALVGHSFGGRVAIKAVGQGLVHPKKLVLIASAGVVEPLLGKEKVLAYAGRIVQFLARVPIVASLLAPLRRRAALRFGSVDYQNAGQLKETFKKVVAEDLRDDAKRIDVPTLLVWGDSDSETPLASGHILADSIRGAELVVIPGAGHFVYQGKVRELVHLMKDFLGAGSPARTTEFVQSGGV